jgi:hypothetical protein
MQFAQVERVLLAARRERKRAGGWSRSQLERLLAAAELRKKATQGERDE